MIRADIKESKILSEYSNNINQFIIKAGAIFVQAIWASTILLTDSFCFCILKKWRSSFDSNIPMGKNGAFVLTYLAGMKIGATSGIQKYK